MSAGRYSNGVPLMPPSGVVAGGRAGRAADPHLEIAVHVELQDKAVAAILVGGPAGCRVHRLGAIAREPDIVILVDIDAVLAVGPDAAIGRLAMAFQPARIGRAAPGAQQLAVGVEFQHRGRGIAAVGHRAIGAGKAKAVLAMPIRRECPAPLRRWSWCAGGYRPRCDRDDRHTARRSGPAASCAARAPASRDRRQSPASWPEADLL